MDNIILMGPPGAGKTTVAQILRDQLNIDWIDVDDHLLEKHWPKSVAETLAEVGDEEFLKKEAQTTLKLKLHQGVISLSGSNPLNKETMNFIRTLGCVFYLDVDVEIIERRLQQMKVDRIVGMKDLSLKDILNYRKTFYESNHDVKIKVTANMAANEIAQVIINNIPQAKLFVSTRGGDVQYGFANVIEQGLARDGGLYVPKVLPELSALEIKALKSLEYADLCKAIFKKFDLGLDFSEAIDSAYEDFQEASVAPVAKIHKNLYMLELFHGPTAAFKDLALQLTPKLIEKATEYKKQKRFVLAATSGDTGVAAISGFSKVKQAHVCVLYPSKGVSPVQRQQMLSLQSEKVKVLAVEGDFDHCQSMVKELFSDKDFQKSLEQKSYKLTAANSINWGRLLPQIVYYFYAYLQWIQKVNKSFGEKLNFVIPTGNFGNILAGFVAKKMGLPLGKLVCASNENNILTEFIHTGVYNVANKSLIPTASPSIDILKSSNIERAIYWLSGGDSEMTRHCFEQLKNKLCFELDANTKNNLKTEFVADCADQVQSLAGIKELYSEYNYLLDPHTAVAYSVYKKLKLDTEPTCIVSTAHYGKFPVAMQQISAAEDAYSEFLNRANMTPPIHKKLWNVLSQPKGKEQSFKGSHLELKSELLASL